MILHGISETGFCTGLELGLGFVFSYDPNYQKGLMNFFFFTIEKVK